MHSVFIYCFKAIITFKYMSSDLHILYDLCIILSINEYKHNHALSHMKKGKSSFDGE